MILLCLDSAFDSTVRYLIKGMDFAMLGYALLGGIAKASQTQNKLRSLYAQRFDRLSVKGSIFATLLPLLQTYPVVEVVSVSQPLPDQHEPRINADPQIKSVKKILQEVLVQA